MPFTGPSDPDLPSNVSGLSLAKREQWVGAFNGRHADCIADGGTADTCESSAFAVANAAIKERAMPDNDKESLTDALAAVAADKVRVEPEYWDFMAKRLPQDRANYNPTGGDADRACSNCQWFIAPGSCAVVDDYPDPIVPNGNSDLWLLRLKREDFMEPMEVIVVGEREAEAKTYAVIGDGLDPDTWQLPLAGDNGHLDPVKVGLAIAALHPGGAQGNRIKLAAKDRQQAFVRLARAIHVLEAEDAVKANLYDRLAQAKAKSGIVEVIVNAPAAIRDKIAAALSGFKTQDPPASASAVATEPILSGTYDSSLTMWKDRDGDIRFLAIMSNRWRDRDLEILSEKSHRGFVGWLDANGYKDEAGNPAMRMWLWHTPGTEWGTVDWAELVNGFMTVSGTVDKGMEDVAERLAVDDDLGVSHGFKYLTDEADRSIITDYRSFEASALPRSVASNPYTALAIIEEARKAMADEKRIPDEKREFLAGKLGDGRVAALEGDTATAAATLETAGVDSKAAGAPAADPVSASGIDMEAFAVAATKAITESKAFTDLTTAVSANAQALTAIDARLKAVEKTEDQKVSEVFTSRVADLTNNRPSQAGDNTIDEDAAKAEGVPKVDIFDMATDQLREMTGEAAAAG